MQISKKALNFHDLIPGGAHTYSRGDDQFTWNAPRQIERGKGYIVWDEKGRQYIDMAMGLRSVSIGHGCKSQVRFVSRYTSKGINFSRPTSLEFELADLLREIIPSAEMIKFGKNGSDANTAAIRLARAYTGKKYILRCVDNPFLSVHDWFIGSTLMDRGIPQEIKDQTLTFRYGVIQDIEIAIQHLDKQVACIILEPASKGSYDVEFLRALRNLCSLEGIVLIFDEVISGFRYSLGGIQEITGVIPDLSTFGKAMGNGYPISALVGIKSLMEVGGILHGQERVFLLSSTFGAERSSLAAALWTIRRMMKNQSIRDSIQVAEMTINLIKSKLKIYGLDGNVTIQGAPINPNFIFNDVEGQGSDLMRAKFQAAGVENGILWPYFSFSESHREKFLKWIESNLEKIMETFLEYVTNPPIELRPIKPVFRKWN